MKKYQISNFKYKILFALFFFLFLFTRLYQITENPPSLYWDEASIGYNAYSILKIGKGEHGTFLPIHFRSFGEYKLPVYIYTVAGFEALLGENELAVRLPAVLFSLGSLTLVYLLGSKILKDKAVALFGVLFLAFTPWMFIFSRTGYEATAGLFFYLLGVYLFLKESPKNFYVLTSSISFLLSVYSYNSFLILSPLTLLILVLSNYKQYLPKNLKQNRLKTMVIVLSVLIWILIALNEFYFISTSGNTRFEQVGITQLSNSRKKLALIFSQNYFSHFSPKFLFINGDKNPRSNTPGFGEIFWVQLPLSLLGLYQIFKKKDKNYYLILVLGLIALIPAALTKESPHALRALSLAVFISIISAIGISWFKKFKWAKHTYAVFLIVLALNFGAYFNNFLVNYPKTADKDWQYPYKQIFTKYGSELNQYDHITITYRYTQPYIYALFYTHYDPAKYQREVKYTESNRRATSLVASFDKFIFTNVFLQDFPVGENLAFAHPDEAIKELPLEGKIYNNDGSVALYVYKYDKK